ncbi:MAG: FAD-dependent oxidoreductase, partial [Candidatus Bathyarchaeia archaeon]
MVNLAVVGAGIGGCSAAYFARKLLSNPEITVYEKANRIGGRVLTFKGEQITSELGGTFFNSSNPTVSPLIAETGLQVKKLEEFMDFAVWNGTEILFQSNHPMFYKMLKLVTKYKLSVPRLVRILNDSHRKLEKMYKKAEQPAEFWELFEAAGLDKWYKHRFDTLLLEAGVNQTFIDELITPITRIIYSQNAEMAGFAGLVALLGVYADAIYSLKDGNAVFPVALLEKSGSTVQLETEVTSIEKTADQTFRVYGGENSTVFDAVIVASPLETANIQFDGTENQNMPKREYQQIYIRLMKGIVDKRFFNMDGSAKLPSIILTSKQA